MTLLEKLIEENLLIDIINLVSSLEEKTLKQNTDKLDNYPLSILPILTSEIIKEVRKNIQKVKLEYYKRNLAVLEIILGNQKTKDNLRFVLKIVRENLCLKNISLYINIYNLYYTYKNKNIYKTKEFILYESQEYYQIENYIKSLNIE